MTGIAESPPDSIPEMKFYKKIHLGKSLIKLGEVFKVIEDLRDSFKAVNYSYRKFNCNTFSN